MFTQSMPALAQALSGALPEAALKQLMQSLGNCQQPLTHRGAINLQPPDATGVGGLATPGTWRASDYNNLFPKAGDNVYVDIAGNTYNNSPTTNTNNYGGNQFSFPINQAFNYNTYYGGDTFNVGGNSTFENTTVNNLRAGDTFVDNLITNNITIINPDGGGGSGGGQGDGGGQGGGGFVPFIPGPGGGGGGFGIPVPAATRVSTFLKDVTVRGTVQCPTVESALVKSKAVTLTNTTATKSVTVTGSVSVPDMSSAKASVSLPTSGSFSGSITGLKLSPGIGTLTGTVTIPVVTGGYLDASCKLQLTTSSTQYSVSFSGAPAVDITSMGSVTGPITLSGSTQTYAVSFACTGTTGVAFSGTGDVSVQEVTAAALTDDTVTLKSGTVTKTLNLTVAKRSDFIIYLRPRA
jgi:hypothetical protein